MLTWIRCHRFSLLSAAAVAVAALLLFLPIATFVVGQEVDYGLHLRYLNQVLNGQPIGAFVQRVPHFGYHLGVVLVFKLFPHLGLQGAAIIVTVFYYILGGLAVLVTLFVLTDKPKTYWSAGIYAGTAIGLMLVMPVNALTPSNLYLGYIPANVYHNPTIVALKPLALGVFLLTGAAFRSQMGGRMPLLAVLLLMVISILAKPSYAIALLPVVGLVAGYYYWRRWPVNWTLLIMGIFIPSVVVLGAQFLFYSGSGFVIAPLAMLKAVAKLINPAAAQLLGLKFFLSILFPLGVYLLNWKEAHRNLYLNLAWLTFFVGAAYMYLLAEGGDRLGHGNFMWSAQVALFILFVVSAAFFLQQSRKALSAWTVEFWPIASFVVNSIFLGLHVLCGWQWYQVYIYSVWMGDIITKVW